MSVVMTFEYPGQHDFPTWDSHVLVADFPGLKLHLREPGRARGNTRNRITAGYVRPGRRRR